MNKRRLGLSNEVHLLIDSIQGIHTLASSWVHSFGFDPTIPASVLALLVQVRERLRLLDRVIQKKIDPRVVWCSENDAGKSNEQDVLLQSWSEKKLLRHHLREWRRMKKRLHWIRREEAKSGSKTR